MRTGLGWSSIVALVLLATSLSANAGIIKSVWVDIDGEGVEERVYYCVGNPGEPDTDNIYQPSDFLAGFAYQVTRLHFGMGNLQEVVLRNGSRVLDTGLPVMVSGRLVIQNPLYQSRETVDYGDSAVTTWIQDDIRLERTVWMNTKWFLSVYKVFTGTDGSLVNLVPCVGTSALSVPWNQGRTPFQQATAYVDSIWTVEHDSLLPRFPSVGGLNGWGLQVSYMFDDWFERRANNYLWAWDDWERAVMGNGFLPVPDTLYLTGPRQPCEQRANVTWSFRDESVGASSDVPLRRISDGGIGIKPCPNPFASFASVPGHEAERFVVYDVSGRMVGAFKGDRIGQGLSPGVYLMRTEARGSETVRIVKTR
jgi:hypothetical protein